MPLRTERQQLVAAALGTVQSQEGARQDATLEERVELVLDELLQIGACSVFGLAMKVAACCRTRRYSVVCSGR